MSRKRVGVLSKKEHHDLTQTPLGPPFRKHRCADGCLGAVCIIETERVVLLAAARHLSRDEDSGGDARLALQIEKVLAAGGNK